MSQAAPAAATPPSVVLTGVFIVDGSPVAMLSGGETTRRARPGDDVEGWQIASIEADEVVLTRGRARHVLELRRYEPAPVVAPSGIVFGATRIVPLPTNAWSPTVVLCFALPS